MKIIDDAGQVIAEGQALTLEPGDVLVFQTKQRLNMQHRALIIESLADLFPDNKTAILDDGAELSIVRRPAKEAVA